MGEKEVEQLEHFKERKLETQGWRGVAYCECPALPAKAMVRSESGSEDHVWFCGYTVAGLHAAVSFMLPLENTRHVLSVAATGDHMDEQNSCCSSWMWHSGEWALNSGADHGGM